MLAEAPSPDWLKSCYEWVICTSQPGQLPWSDNTALGHSPKFNAGGELSYRTLDGSRINTEKRKMNKTPSGYRNGDTTHRKTRSPVPDIANPGNVIYCPSGHGNMGSEMCHDNEAPFPEDLAAFFVLSFAPPGGLVCDPFSGSGTTAAVSKRHGRNFTGCDLRQSQVELGLKRVANETPLMFT